ncbi:hypothetical protein C8J57DRAFT_1220452 [Mycena rebaudengoi]|nr:hypothetical protein C8J57DRAFT_1252037 [Mycena rebaudengoi]KAJ7279915.1 hypothetical protein C8J57DRAFT_1220452 [Mycena rebaudengoi]
MVSETFKTGTESTCFRILVTSHLGFHISNNLNHCSDLHQNMDQFYDMEGAVVRLNKLTNRRKTATEDRSDPSDRHLAAIEIEGLDIHQTGNRRRDWRLSGDAGSNGVRAELTTRLQGIIASLELIPSARDIKR